MYQPATRLLTILEILPARPQTTEGALAKSERVLPLAVAERLRALQDAIGFTQPPPPSSPAPADVLLDPGADPRAEYPG